jgi:hypothetical protein
MSIRELRPRLLKQSDILQAILAFNYALTATAKESIDVARGRIPFATANDLRAIRDRLQDALKKYVRFFGCVQKPSAFSDEFNMMSRGTWGVQNVLKAAIDREYFTNFCGGNPIWEAYPPHLRLQVGLQGP